MNTVQIKYFLAAATTLNFTEAAKSLFISQPALSKQISALEQELNMVLFVRQKQRVILTPAGSILLEGLPKIEQQYDEIIHKAQVANAGMSGEINIGILEGQMVGDLFTRSFAAFTREYPNISVRLVRRSFSGLQKQLIDGSIDLAITLKFDVEHNPAFQFEEIAASEAIAVVSKNHPLADKLSAGWEDLRQETFIVIDEKDSLAGSRKVMHDFKHHGFTPHIIWAPTLETVMLWVEAGLGIGIVNTMNNLAINPSIHILKDIQLEDTHTVLAWSKSRVNPAIMLFVNFVASMP